MRCKACNRLLDDKELTRKGNDGSFLDLCTECGVHSNEAVAVAMEANAYTEKDEKVVYKDIE